MKKKRRNDLTGWGKRNIQMERRKKKIVEEQNREIDTREKKE